MDGKETSKSIFVSYGREPNVTLFIRQLKRDLEANDFSVWLDTESIPSGRDWHGAIGTGLQNCVAIIPIITQKYVDSRFCMNELYTADSDKKFIFPIMFEDVDLSSTETGRAVKFIVSGINWTMFRPGVDNYAVSLQKLIDGMKERMREKDKEDERAEEDAKKAAVVLSVGPSSTKPLKMLGGIQFPASIATGRHGEIVVASYMGHTVHVYDSDYKFLRMIGSNGFMDGQFMCPSGLAVDQHNRVFVSSMSKIDVFTMEGQFLNAAGQQGNGPLQFTNAASVAVGKGGEVFVADTQNNRIQVLNSDLTFCTSFSKASENLGSGHLNQPYAVAINSEGNLYVADMMNHAVQAFTPKGKFLLRFGTYGAATTPGAMCSPMAIAIDGQDNVYVGSVTGSIGIFDKDGNFLRQFGSYGSELGQFSQIRGMHIDKKGRLYVSEGSTNRLQIFPGSASMMRPEEDEEEEEGEKATDEKSEITNKTTATIGLSKPAYLIGPKSMTPVKILSNIENATGVAVGKNGEVIVASWQEHKVFVYDAKNNYRLIATIGKEGNFDGEFYYPSGVAVTLDNYILVSSHNKLQWFTMEGHFAFAVGSQGKEKMEFDDPTDISVGRDGRVYVLDSNNKRVQIFNGDATYHSSFGFPFLVKDDDKPPSALAVNSEGKLFFTDSSNNCVHVFSSSGESLFKFGKSGSWMERGVLTSPMSIAIDSEDNVFVGSIFMISIFDKSGSFIRAFGGHGSDPGQFSFIRGLHVDTYGNLFVSDLSDNRVQIFEGSGPSTASKEEETLPANFTTLSTRKPAYLIGPSSLTPIKVLSDIPESFGVTEGRNGEIIAVSKKQDKVFIYSSKDNYQRVLEIGGRGGSDGKFLNPIGVAVTAENLIIVSSQDKLQWFTMEGKLVYVVGGTGTEEMKFNHPTGIAVGRDGRIYVIDEKNKRVQIINGDATFGGSFGFAHLKGPKDEPPCDVAINSEGTLYFADTKNNCIRAFSSSGKPLFNFGKSGSWLERGVLLDPMALAIDAEDNVFVGDRFKISIFDKSGSIIRVLAREFNRIRGLCIGKNGHLYVSDYNECCVQIYESKEQSSKESEKESSTVECIGLLTSRRPIFSVGPSSDKPIKVLSNIADPWGVTTSSDGDLFIVSRKDKKVSIYDGQNYEFKEEIRKIYWETTRDNEIAAPTCVTVCEDGCLLLSLKCQLAKINVEGEVLASVGKKGRPGRSEDELNSPNGIALAKDGKVYVVDSGNNRVQIFHPDLSYSGTFHCHDNLNRPTFKKAAVNSHGNIYVTDRNENCIQVFSPDGKYLFSFGKKGNSSDREATNSPVAIAIDHEDYVYISRSDVMVSIFDREGTFVRAFGERGEEEGQFRDITAMHIDRKGNLYICESSNNRVQIFSGIKSLEEGEKDRVDVLEREEEKYKATLPVTFLPDIIQDPHGVAEGNNGEIVVVSCSSNKVFVYDHGYRLTVQFGGQGNLDGFFQNPTGVAVTSDNYILVSSQDKLQWFTMEGQLVYAVGCNGKGEVEFNHPDDISVDREGRIYVLEKQNKRVQILKGNGTYESCFSLKVDYPPEALAVNSEGKVFLVDPTNNCIRIYSSDGLYLSKFSSLGFKELALPTAITVDSEDMVYVGTGSGMVAKFDKEGVFVDAFRISRDVPGQFNVIRRLHIGKSGKIYVSDVTNSRVQIFGHHDPLASSPVNFDVVSSPPKLLPYKPAFTVGPKSSMPFKILTGVKHPSGITTDTAGNVFVASDWENEIFVFSSAACEAQSRIKEIENPRNPRDNRIYRPSGLAFTSDGFLLVSFSNQLVKMSLQGKAELFFGNEKNRSGKMEHDLNNPGGIAVGQDGRIYVVDRGNHRIQILQGNFDYVKSYANPDERERSSEYLEDAALNSNGDLYVTDERNCNVQVFNQKGRFLFTFGIKNSSRNYKRGELSRPSAIAIDQEDYVYVGGYDGVVSIFDKKGKFVRSFGGKGDQPGLFRDIKGMHIDSRGKLYIADWDNNRIQVFQ